MSEIVKIDFQKLEEVLKAAGKTKADLSREMAKGRNYVGKMESNPEQPEEIERLMCLLLGLEPGTLIKKEQASAAEVRILENMYKELKELRKIAEETAEKIDKIYGKVHANTLQLEKLKDKTGDCLQALNMTDYDKASRFLKETLSGGRMDGAEVLRMADAAGIKRAYLNKAKRDIGVDTAVTGYGKGQKTWWFLAN